MAHSWEGLAGGERRVGKMLGSWYVATDVVWHSRVCFFFFPQFDMFPPPPRGFESQRTVCERVFCGDAIIMKLLKPRICLSFSLSASTSPLPSW